mmetsp:Transcript_109723/g.283565  ORF Transcript_109723/g.283565 Transcript_109723/m.283565 type:complete len:918 (-) Transcript_109723:273-3026(-)
MHAGTAAAAAAGASGAGGAWLFSYNKENFGNDAGMRFGRFMMARGNANAQVAQYREDIAGITGMTVSKMDAWQTVTTLFLAVGAALSCAGRIGMHGCAPPGWYCALFSGSIFMSIMFNGTSLWLSMHASLRAQCAATSLLTRKVRLPIPSMGQLDQARVFGSTFEKQELRDIFRVPFMRHPHDAPDMPTPESEGDGAKKSKKKAKAAKDAKFDPHQEFGSTARDTVPSWIRDEVVVDKGDGFPAAGAEELHEPGEAPDHFKLLMKAQEEWRDYDVYARITMLYGVVSFLYAVTYYAVGTAIAELRGFWVMWSMPMVFLTAQTLVLRLDILRDGHHRLPNAELFGSMAPYFAVAACSLEYRYYYSEAQKAVTWGLALLAFFAHLVMNLRMLDLAWPDRSPSVDMPEEPGKQWWPASWKVPRAFTKNLWFITPPTKLEDGQHCLLHEMQDMAVHGGGVSVCRRRRPSPAKAQPPAMSQESGAGEAYSGASPFRDFGLKRANDLPWQLTRVVILTACLQWIFVMFTTSAEIILGPESLLKPPGEPPWIRDTKYRSWGPEKIHLSSAGALPSDYRLFAASTARYTDDESTDSHSDAHGATDAHHRRLEKANLSQESAAFEELLKLVPALGELADKIQGGEAYHAAGDGLAQAPSASSALPAPQSGFMAPASKVQSIVWPSLFEPRHLLCGPHTDSPVIALTPRGVGALVNMGLQTANTAEQSFTAEPFALEGLGQWGPLAGAARTQRGLQLLTTTGKLLHCAGHQVPAGGAWPCQESQHPPLPMPTGSELVSAAFAEDASAASTNLLVALVFKNMPEIAALYRAVAGSWHPAGEVHVPPGSGPQPSLGFDGVENLLVTGAAGEVHRRHLAGGTHALHPAPAGASAREFRSACVLPEGQIIRLALRQMDTSAPSRPELILSA